MTREEDSNLSARVRSAVSGRVRVSWIISNEIKLISYLESASSSLQLVRCTPYCTHLPGIYRYAWIYAPTRCPTSPHKAV